MESRRRSKATLRRQGVPRQLQWRGLQDKGQFLSFRAQTNDSLSLQRFFKEVTVWKRLNHPNVIPNLGASLDIAEFCVVSPWMPDGDLSQHLSRHPAANRPLIVSIHVAYLRQHAESVPKMIGVANGLSYLHSNDVIHGDLKGVSHIRYRGLNPLTSFH